MNGEAPKFFADSMLGKLARWLRTLGCDVEYERHIEDDALIKRALTEDRIVLTRDTLLIRRRRLRGRVFFIESGLAGDQLKAVVDRFNLSAAGFLTRCLRCNALLERVEKDAVKVSVPPYVYQTHNEFSVCPECARVYWGGTHREGMLREMERMLKA
ncbi:MAG: Mut7-C RNAse domain-containing protein [Deltaproteobacteria bacterium]